MTLVPSGSFCSIDKAAPESDTSMMRTPYSRPLSSFSTFEVLRGVMRS